LIKDITNSVQAKLGLFLNENDAILTQDLPDNKALFFPSRIFFEFEERKSNSYLYCDYVSAGEKIEVCSAKI